MHSCPSPQRLHLFHWRQSRLGGMKRPKKVLIGNSIERIVIDHTSERACSTPESNQSMASLDSHFLSCCQQSLTQSQTHVLEGKLPLSSHCMTRSLEAVRSSQHGANAEMVPSPGETARLRHHRACTPPSPLPPVCRISSSLLREPSIILDGVTGQVNSKHVLCWEITEC
ncbi:hypothetical protein SRHO_G00145710 [Serrasalmus rhombeus]